MTAVYGVSSYAPFSTGCPALCYRMAMCTFALATSYAAILLLPGSVIGNEVIHLHSGNYYIQWLTNSLVQGKLAGSMIGLI